MSALQRGSRNCLRNPYQPRGTSSYKSVCLSPSSPIDPSLFHTLSLFFPSFPNHHHLCNEPREPCRQRLRQLISVISTIVRCSMSLKSKRSLSLSLSFALSPNPPNPLCPLILAVRSFHDRLHPLSSIPNYAQLPVDGSSGDGGGGQGIRGESRDMIGNGL